ncbi:V-type proton ATPase 16 kDa proteolipid subunit-like isoform X2 [Camellia sinensis]|uniref:V-type proton ATPase 16 kDa proteolipid subunit-like isoform X2 n=1 Tax=Camellia sinensis TaxID=4442 RepID=UPI001036166D|nr:V-type proton ATPase 16 kDa proteolipid subunit-like isoform X2 [Camellia sinensis]
MAWRRFATLLRQRTDDINDGARKIVSLGVGGCIGCLFCDWFYEIHGMQPSKERRANAQQPKLFVCMILILIFAEALALYGLIVGIILSIFKYL